MTQNLGIWWFHLCAYTLFKHFARVHDSVGIQEFFDLFLR